MFNRAIISVCIIILAGLIVTAPAKAAPCVTVTVSTATVADIPKLLADADCFTQLAAAAKTAKQRKSYLQSATLRRNKAAELQATIPPPPPVVLPPPAPPVEGGLVELPAIATNFDRAPFFDVRPIPITEPVEGAFRLICTPAHLSYDDPIVWPGQPGKAHLHQFFGNTKADAFSTYESLRTTGDSTCNNPLNRSGYWIPAMMNGKGKVVRPDYVSVYYKRRPSTDPICDWTKSPQGQGKACVKLPRGLKYIFGYDMVNMKPAADPNSVWFNCDGPGALPGHYKTITEAAANCPANGLTKLGAVAFAPSCWNGKDLDSPDHQSHMAYASYGSWGYLRCPDTHPYIIPQFTLGAWYTTDSDLPGWRYSSDEMHGSPGGSTFHADWDGAWDDVVLQTWHDNCIEKLLSCSGGDLGNGTGLKVFSAFSWTANPRLVDIPPRP